MAAVKWCAVYIGPIALGMMLIALSLAWVGSWFGLPAPLMGMVGALVGGPSIVLCPLGQRWQKYTIKKSLDEEFGE